MAIDPKLVDKLLADYKRPEDIIGENGLLKQLPKAVLKRALSLIPSCMISSIAGRGSFAARPALFRRAGIVFRQTLVGALPSMTTSASSATST